MYNWHAIVDETLFFSTSLFKNNGLLTRVSLDSLFTDYGLFLPISTDELNTLDIFHGEPFIMSNDQLLKRGSGFLITSSGKIYNVLVICRKPQFRRLVYGEGARFALSNDYQTEESVTTIIDIVSEPREVITAVENTLTTIRGIQRFAPIADLVSLVKSRGESSPLDTLLTEPN